MANQTITTNRNAGLERFGVVHSEPEIFAGLVAAITVIPAGTILGRVTASGDLTPWDSAAVDGSEVPVAVLSSELTTDAVPTDIPGIRPIISGRVAHNELFQFPAGVETALTATPLTPAQRDLLRDFTIVTEKGLELSKLDNGAV